jgi:hypothetical protein
MEIELLSTGLQIPTLCWAVQEKRCWRTVSRDLAVNRTLAQVRAALGGA